MQNKDRLIRVDFSLRREVLFVVVGAIVGALVMIIPKNHFGSWDGFAILSYLDSI
jgi:hypothetical protein